MTKLLSVCCIMILLITTACKKDLLIDPDSEIITTTSSQARRSCDHERHQSKLINDPKYRLDFDKRYSKAEQVLRLRSNSECENPIILPVAVHFQNAGNTDMACLRTLAQRQVEILNADFSATNDDIAKWNAFSDNFPDVSLGNSCIQFCLPTKNHPPGFGIGNGDLAVTKNTTSSDVEPSWSGYLNIFVQPDLGFLGYAPLGGIGNGDGVVIDANAFGAGAGCGSIAPQAPFNLGRTLTHEVGHYLLLDHLWGDGGCSGTDDVDDTPTQAEPNGGCPSANTQQCGSLDLHMSYMDYTDDACMYMFSAGQGDRMHAYTKANLQNLINKASDVCGETSGGDDPANPEVCSAPVNIRSTAITENSIAVEWEGEESNFQVAIREEGENVWSNRSSSESNFTFQNLKSDTEYRIRVRSNCGSEKSAWIALDLTTNEEQDEEDDCPGFGFNFSITLDDYPEETEWRIMDRESGDVLFSGGPFAYEDSGKTISTDFCLPNGCYVVQVTDTYGDGICCEYGEGNFIITSEDQDVVFESDGGFGASEQIFLCVKADGQLKTSSQRVAKRSNLKVKKKRS